MSWYTDLFCNITFNRETYNNKYEVEDKIDELQKCLEVAKSDIRDLVVMTEPSKFCPKDEDPYCWMINEYKGCLELIEEYSIELYKLNLLLNNWDACHDKEGLAINPPKEITYETAFIDGDYIKSAIHE